MAQSVLVIEDNSIVCQMVDAVLSKEGFRVFIADTGEKGLQIYAAESIDLILLDLMLPRISGDEILMRIRQTSQIPVIIISAKDTDVEKAIRFTLGADDYLAKPFSMIELVARVKAVLRRAYRNNPSLQHEKVIGNLKVDLDNFEAFLDDQPLFLTLKEYLILKLFVTNPNQVFSKEQIYKKVWNDDYYQNDNLINVHMRRLREKIEKDPSKPQIIKTIWGIGYKYEE